MPTVVCPARTRLGDSVVAINNACLLAKEKSDVLLVPHRKIFSWEAREINRVIECFEFALSLFNLGSLKVSNEERMAKELSKLPQSSFVENAKPFIREAHSLVLLDLFPRCGCNKFSKELQDKILEVAKELGEPVDLHRFANRNGLSSTLGLFKLAKCFIGADSGFAHVSHALGVPCFMFRNRGRVGKLEKWHNGNQYTLVEDPEDLLLYK